MIERDFDAFAALMDDAATLLGKPVLGERQMALYFAALADHSLQAVRKAALAHMRDPQRGRFMPAPADLIAQINGAAEQDGRPGPEEAFGIALKAADESRAVVWTAEIAQAWGEAQTVYEKGGEVAARLNFKEVYIRLVDEARRNQVPVTWTTSVGTGELRERQAETADATRIAADRGRLPAPAEVLALPGSAEAAAALNGLEHRAPPEAVEGLLALKSALAAKAAEPSLDVKQRQQTEGLKAEADRKAREAGVSLDECPGNVSDLMALAKARAARLAQGGGEGKAA